MRAVSRISTIPEPEYVLAWPCGVGNETGAENNNADLVGVMYRYIKFR